MNIIDKAISVFSPKAAYERVSYRVAISAMNSYSAANVTEKVMRNWNPVDMSADMSVNGELDIIRSRAHDLVRNSPIAKAIVDTFDTCVVGGGLKFQSEIDYKRLGMSRQQAKDIEREIDYYVGMWAESKECDAARQHNFYELQSIAYRDAYISGDAFALLPMFSREGSPFGLKVALIDASRIANEIGVPNTGKLFHGIERNSNGEPLYAHIRQAHPNDYMEGKKRLQTKKVRFFGKNTGRQNIIHITNAKRIGQTRGYPELAAAIKPIKQIEKYVEQELLASIIANIFTVAIKTTSGVGAMGGFDQPVGQSQAARELSLGSGNMVELSTGEDIQMIDPKRPAPQFSNFIQENLILIGMASEIPREILTKSFTSSYSASQAAMLEYWRTITSRRDKFVYQFAQPIVDSFIGELVASGKIKAAGFFDSHEVRRAFTKGRWIGRPKGHIREDVAAKASKILIENRLSTRQAEAAQLTGGDWEAMNEQLLHEESMIPVNENEQKVMPKGEAYATN